MFILYYMLFVGWGNATDAAAAAVIWVPRIVSAT